MNTNKIVKKKKDNNASNQNVKNYKFKKTYSQLLVNTKYKFSSPIRRKCKCKFGFYYLYKFYVKNGKKNF